MEAVRETKCGLRGGHLLHRRHPRPQPRRSTRFEYYVEMAKELERMGAHVLAIKDMAGLCKPYAAQKLVNALREEIGIPIHFHTHDTSGINAASILKASDAGVDVADAAIASMSGTTSQPNLNSVVAALANTPRATGLDFDALNECADYWETVRTLLSAVRQRAEVGHRRGVHPRDAGRPVHQPEGAGRVDGPRRALDGSRPHLRRGQHGARRHREGDAVEQGGRRPGAVPGQPRRPRFRTCCGWVRITT